MNAFSAAYKRAAEKGWDRIYVLVDIHGTIFRPSYERIETYEYYPLALDTLRNMSRREEIRIILWSSSYTDQLMKYKERLEVDGIKVDWINENPEVQNTELQCFSDKLYFNIGIDDKFGFDPEVDWEEVYDFFKLP